MLLLWCSLHFSLATFCAITQALQQHIYFAIIPRNTVATVHTFVQRYVPSFLSKSTKNSPTATACKKKGHLLTTNYSTIYTTIYVNGKNVLARVNQVKIQSEICFWAAVCQDRWSTIHQMIYFIVQVVHWKMWNRLFSDKSASCSSFTKFTWFFF